MNWKQAEGRWHQMTGHFKSQWAKLGDDNLENLAGKKQQLVGELEERYGVAKDDVEKQIDETIAKFSPSGAPGPAKGSS